MAAILIDGKAIAEGIRADVARETAVLREQGRRPCLAAILAGDDSAAVSYARSQARYAEGTGMDYRLVELPAETTMPVAADVIADLNADPTVSGIMLHLPLGEHLNAFTLQQMIAAGKDVEGVGAANLGLLAMGREAMLPCTAAAAFACLQSTGIKIEGCEAVVVGRSVIVGKPLAMLLLGAHATVTLCHTRTRDLAAHTRRADVLVVAAGKAGLIGAEHVSPGTVVIDVGMHRVPVTDGAGEKKMKTVGDVRFDEVAPIAKAITPVPGGVGPVTVAMLLANTIKAAYRRSAGQQVR
ncbi:MAG: bifunctional 5,10-methylenetetrahydrofolate dehydrogenase/5,10-methenyltetrahydrofolate cyclohydrolase [Phycisphaerae bacterium]|nr:bifunctional 5,10-methylenetetrahydrofolate dehydrogenase/5,10-methenyltetrahydrofolate cyclohydrolase [Phycisphaerae bacterium]